MYLAADSLGQLSAAAFDDDVDILAWTAEKTVADIASDDKRPDAHLGGSF